MELTLGLLADAANTTPNNKLNLPGVFRNITATDYPAIHPSMDLVLRFSTDPVERGQEYPLSIVLVDSDGSEVLSVKGRVRVPNDRPADMPLDVMLQIPFRNTAFPHAGQYTFVIVVDGETKGRIPLTMSRTAEEVH